jgi:uncharacterized protein involved in outer membrane biogenesis
VNSALRKTLKITGIALASLVVIVLLILALFDWNTLKHPLERMASAETGRTVSIGGKLDVHIWSWTPTRHRESAYPGESALGEHTPDGNR